MLHKNILIIRNAYSYDFGGGEIFPIELAQQLQLNGYNPIVTSRSKLLLKRAQQYNLQTIKGWWWSRQDWGGYKIVVFPLYIVWQLILFFWYILIITRARASVVHIQSRDDFISATLAARILGKRVVWTDHADLKYIFTNFGTWYKNPIGKLVYLAGLLAHTVTILSQSEKKLIEESLGRRVPHNFLVVYLGVKDVFKPNLKKNNSTVLVTTSRLVKTKGIQDLIKAFKIVNTPNAELRIYGNGPDVDYLKSLANGEKNIEFFGHTSTIDEILRNSDIFIHPSHHEGFGLSLVEAEMSMLPIIAYNVDSIPEIVQDGVNGILVPFKNIEELANAIIKLISDKKLRETMGKNSRNIYLHKFQLNKIIKKRFIPLYES